MSFNLNAVWANGYLPQNVLLVEDVASYRQLVIEAFATASPVCQLHSVNSAEAALAFLSQQPDGTKFPRPDLILLDLNLPQMGGIELLKIIKSDSHWQTIPVIILSSSPKNADIRESYQQLANCYIKKPTNWESLINLVENILFFWFQVVTLPPSSGYDR